MKFIIKKNVLLENLVITAKAISTKNLVPVLSGIKFNLTKEGLYLTASDNDIIIQTFIDKKEIDEILEIGSIVIPGKYIVDIIRKIPNEIVNISKEDGNKIFIKFNSGEYNINSISAEEFPKLELQESKNPIKLKSIIFKEIISETVFAISNSETRPILTGLNLRINNNILECYATDSYRLAKKIVKVDSDISNVNIVIPGKNLIDFKNIVIDDEKEIELHLFENKILFKFDNILFQSKLLSGNYPEVSKLIPETFKINLKIKTGELYDVIDRASLLSNDRDKVIIKLNLNNSIINISSNTPELGKVEENINIDSESNIVISFVSKYMLEALRSYDNKDIILCFNEEDKPFIIKDEKDNSLVQLILPIKTY